MALIDFTNKGIYCKQGNFYIDPWHPVDYAVTTHGHVDHVKFGNKNYLCHDLTKPILLQRYGLEENATQCKEETLYPISGHIHPGISIIGKAKQRLKFPCFYFGKKYAVLPAFSTFTGLFTLKPNKGDDIYAITPTQVSKV